MESQTSHNEGSDILQVRCPALIFFFFLIAGGNFWTVGVNEFPENC